MSQITWIAFFKVIFFILFVYYIIIAVLYYRKTFNLSLFNKIFRQSLRIDRPSVKDTPAITTLQTTITLLIKQASDEQYTKEKILFALHKLLQIADNKQLNKPFNKAGINQHITDTCQQYCSIHLSEEDLRVLWI